MKSMKALAALALALAMALALPASLGDRGHVPESMAEPDAAWKRGSPSPSVPKYDRSSTSAIVG